MYKFKLFVQLLVISAVFTFNSCKTDDVVIPDEVETNEVIIKENEALAAVVPSTEITTFLTGKISDEQGNPLKDVAVSSGTTTVLTGDNGYFTFGEIELNESYAFIKAKKEGYLLGTRTFTPTENAFNTISIQLLSKGNAQTFSASTGGQLTVDSDLELTFPANSIIKKDGSAYNGNVKVYGRYLSPTAENLSEIMPGMLAGLINSGTIEPMISYGMFAVELEDEAGNELEIEGNSLVEVKAPASQNAPETIPLWHFNETYGLWIEAGTATKVGDKYVSEVNHFSTWNLDTYTNGFEVEVTLVDQNSNPIANQTIQILNENENLLATVFTDNYGQFSLVNAPQNLTFRVGSICNEFLEIQEDISSGSVTLVMDFSTFQSTRAYTFFGQLKDCEDGIEITYNNSYFTIVGTNASDNIYFGGVSDDDGNYDITTVFCNIDDVSSYGLKATISITGNTLKDTSLNITFSGNNQLLDIDFCGIVEDTVLDDFVIPFQDEILEQAIRDQINKPEGAILFADVKNISVVDVYGYGIANVSGLEYFQGLEYLSIGGISTNDFSPIVGLTNLTYLDLSQNNLSDVSVVSGLISLKELNLSENYILEDISPIATLTNLEHLNIAVNSVSTITALNNLTNLYFLGLSQNSITDISGLSNLSNLELLGLSYNSISDLALLSNLTKLRNLSIGNNEITNISSLSNLINLEYLELFENSITDVSPLQNLSKLENLFISSNLIEDISSLTGLVNLELLNLRDNSIENILPLCDLGSSFDGEIKLSPNPYISSDLSDLRNCLPLATIY